MLNETKVSCHFYPTLVKFGDFEKATKFEKLFHLIFVISQYLQILSGRFFQILFPYQKVRTLYQATEIL